MSKLKTQLENQVFYRSLTTPEWNYLRGHGSNEFLTKCISRPDYATFIKNFIKNKTWIKGMPCIEVKPHSP